MGKERTWRDQTEQWMRREQRVDDPKYEQTLQCKNESGAKANQRKCLWLQQHEKWGLYGTKLDKRQGPLHPDPGRTMKVVFILNTM